MAVRPLSSFDQLAALFANQGFLLILQYSLPGPRALVALRAQEENIGDMNGSFFFNDAPLAGLAGRPGMTLNKINLFHHDPVLLGKDPQDFPALPLLRPRDDEDQVIFLNVKLDRFHGKPRVGTPSKDFRR